MTRVKKADKPMDIIVTFPPDLTATMFSSELANVMISGKIVLPLNHSPNRELREVRCFIAHRGNIHGFFQITGTAKETSIVRDDGTKVWSGKFFIFVADYRAVVPFKSGRVNGFRYADPEKIQPYIKNNETHSD